jgi:hypothetical protein
MCSNVFIIKGVGQKVDTQKVSGLITSTMRKVNNCRRGNFNLMQEALKKKSDDKWNIGRLGCIVIHVPPPKPIHETM